MPRGQKSFIEMCKETGVDLVNLVNLVKDLHINQNLNERETAEKLGLTVYNVKAVKNYFGIEKSRDLRLQASQAKAKRTCVEKYGVDHPSKSQAVRSKTSETCRERYGVDHPLQCKEFLDKSKETCKNHYGVDHPLKSKVVQDRMRSNYSKNHSGIDHPWKDPEVRRNIRETSINRYGGIGLESEEIRDKIRSTMKVRYGSENPVQSEVIKSRIQETNYSRYGFKNPIQSEEVKSKIRETCMEKYGVPYACMAEQCISASGKIISKINKSFSDYLRNEFGIDSEFEFHIGKHSYDLHVLNSNLLIEIDPTYTHNSTVGTHYGSVEKNPLSSNYHFEKTQDALDNGYRCVHVFDWDSWDKVANLVNPNKIKIYARKCEIKEVSKEECNSFLNLHHLQNTCNGQKIRYGLYYNDQLVQLMTFGKPRYNKNYEWELLRLCSHKDYKIVGGSERLFKHFIADYNPESIISYCDRAKFNGDVYDELGFVLDHSTRPTPHWFNGSKHFTHSFLLANGADRILGTSYGKGTNNEELMIQHGFVQIYDCGQNVYIWKE